MTSKTTKIDVSVIIPVYNTKEYLTECVQSVISQTYNNLEIILVDDGSTDGSGDLCDSFLDKDSRARVFHMENGGVSRARNFGLEAAKGKYIYFLDSDDYILPNAMQELVKLAECYDVDAVYFDSDLKKELAGIAGPDTHFNAPEFEKKVFSMHDFFALTVERKMYTGSVCRQFWRKDFLNKHCIRFMEGKMAEDALFSTEALLKNGKILLTNTVYHIYRRHGGSASTNVSEKKAVSMFFMYCRLITLWANCGVEDNAFNKAISIRAMDILKLAKCLWYRNKRVISKDDFASAFEKHLFEVVMQNDSIATVEFSENELKRLRAAKHVILYGAGSFAVKVAMSCESKRIPIFSLAVTKMQPNSRGIGEIHIHEICDLKDIAGDSLVVLACSPKNNKEILKTLLDCGFNDIMLLESLNSSDLCNNVYKAESDSVLQIRGGVSYNIRNYKLYNASGILSALCALSVRRCA